jgi:aromatic-L-amino-acid decarboxylase
MAAIDPEMRWVLAGVERADSLVVNPHKWLFTPLECSTFFTRRLHTVRAAFSLVPAYLETSEDPLVRNYMDYGPQLGRSFRALKLWFTLRSFGAEGVRTRIREHIRLGKIFAGWVEAAPNWEVLAPVHFSTVCFRAVPPGFNVQKIDTLNRAIMDRVNATGEVFLSPTQLRGAFSLRIAVGSIRTQERHVARLWELLNEALAVEREGPEYCV